MAAALARAGRSAGAPLLRAASSLRGLGALSAMGVRSGIAAPIPAAVTRATVARALGAGAGRGLASDASESSWAHVRESFSNILVDVDKEGIATLTLNRPDQLNALNSQTMQEVVTACIYLDREHPDARVIIITGSGKKAFAAGADIKEMASVTYSEAYERGLLNGWETLRSVRLPLIAAVNGYALGGGCELAMMCDIVIASDSASFGQPEIQLGVIPGMGGTQRLTHAVGKSRAMELVLTGARITAGEAVKMGLASRAVPGETLMEECRKVAGRIAAASAPVVAKAKECVNMAFESSLGEGIRFEKREFWSCFALADQKEGMAAFVQKRKPDFKHA